MLSRILFWVFLCFSLTSWASPPLALALGLLLALTAGNPYKAQSSKVMKILLQVSVVGLGFGMNFPEVLAAGKNGVPFTLCSIVGTLLAGYFLGRILSIRPKTAFLIATGTAICGGSAIAAVAPVVAADDRETAVALGTVFILNAVALFLFPWLGHHWGMSPERFGLWSAIAIHDTSSVVGAAAHYGGEALKIATTIKLTRALWILPLASLVALVLKKKGKGAAFPWFILAFVGASLIVGLFPAGKIFYTAAVSAAKTGLTVTLFLIGASLSRDAVKSVGLMPVVMGVILWFAVSVISFQVIERGHFVMLPETVRTQVSR